MTAATLCAQLRKEARQYPPGSPDSEYRLRAAWKLYQIAHGVPSIDWTNEPPREFADEREAA